METLKSNLNKYPEPKLKTVLYFLLEKRLTSKWKEFRFKYIEKYRKANFFNKGSMPKLKFELTKKDSPQNKPFRLNKKSSKVCLKYLLNRV